MRQNENVDLAPLTTLGVGGPARRLALAETDEEACALVGEVDGRGEPLLVLGGGSNLLVGDEGFPGTVLGIRTKGLTFENGPHAVFVTAAAGESWDDFVAQVVERGLAGVECLAGIPGLVGAVPMQNVGAYGQEVADTIVSVRAFDRTSGEVVEIPRSACGFAYRSSVFRGKDRHVFLGVTFALTRSRDSRPLAYAELTRALGVEPGASAPLGTVRETVVALRRKKGMVLDAGDPDSRSAGSFFTNPILDPSALAALEARAPGPLPTFPDASGRTKVSAAWLIEQAGFAKGHAQGAAGISSKHALALVNRGGARAADIVALARAIRDGVRERFGVVLENEPVTVGVSL